LGTYRDLWADRVAEANPALRFLASGQTLELAPADAERLGLAGGERVEVRAGDRTLIATVGLRERMLAGTAFLAEGTATAPAGLLAGAGRISIAPAPEPEPEPAAAAADELEASALVVTKREPVSW
jgi:anaerobic selenocysteine-containing dehydrogenase